MSDSSPTIRNAIPASVETTVPNTIPQPVPLSRQQPPAPAPYTFSPSYPDGMELVESMSAEGGIVVEKVRIGEQVFQRWFNTATGDGELRPVS